MMSERFVNVRSCLYSILTWSLVQVETKNSSGSTPLHVASYYGSRDMINLLLDRGADQTHKNKAR